MIKSRITPVTKCTKQTILDTKYLVRKYLSTFVSG